MGHRSVEPAKSPGLMRLQVCVCCSWNRHDKKSSHIWAQPGRQHAQQYFYTYADFFYCKELPSTQLKRLLSSDDERMILKITNIMPDPVFKWDNMFGHPRIDVRRISALPPPRRLFIDTGITVARSTATFDMTIPSSFLHIMCLLWPPPTLKGQVTRSFWMARPHITFAPLRLRARVDDRAL